MIKKRHKANKKWPRNVDEAIRRIMSELSDKDKNIIKNSSFNDLIHFHFSLGMWIRNNFGLWKGNRELARSLAEKFPDRVLKLYDCEHVEPDSASMVIIEEVWKKLQD
jgi:hypothetical protein